MGSESHIPALLREECCISKNHNIDNKVVGIQTPALLFAFTSLFS